MKNSLFAAPALLIALAIGAAAEPAPRRAADFRALSGGQALRMTLASVGAWGARLEEARRGEDFMTDRDVWSPQYRLAAGAAEGAYVYLRGVRLRARIGAWSISLQTPSGPALSGTLSSGDGNLGRLGLGRAGRGWTAEAGFDVQRGGLQVPTLNLSYRLRYG